MQSVNRFLRYFQNPIYKEIFYVAQKPSEDNFHLWRVLDWLRTLTLVEVIELITLLIIFISFLLINMAFLKPNHINVGYEHWSVNVAVEKFV